MTQSRGRNVPASIRQRLLNLAHEQRVELQYLLNRYASERLLSRLSQSAHGQRFTLKGATLFSVWIDAPDRPTWDVDLLGTGSPDPALMEALFREVCGIAVDIDDGLVFPPDAITASTIRKSEAYLGVRVQILALLGNARVPLQIDIGFGDAVIPAAQEVQLPALLALPSPRMRVYPREAVVAEKFEAMVSLGMTNSRMKDFYDIWLLACHFAFEESILAQAVIATFERRRTPLPDEIPTPLTNVFVEDADKRRQWAAFIKRTAGGKDPTSLASVVEALRTFLLPVLQRSRTTLQEPIRCWPPGGPWQDPI